MIKVLIFVFAITGALCAINPVSPSQGPQQGISPLTFTSPTPFDLSYNYTCCFPSNPTNPSDVPGIISPTNPNQVLCGVFGADYVYAGDSYQPFLTNLTCLDPALLTGTYVILPVIDPQATFNSFCYSPSHSSVDKSVILTASFVPTSSSNPGYIFKSSTQYFCCWNYDLDPSAMFPPNSWSVFTITGPYSGHCPTPTFTTYPPLPYSPEGLPAFYITGTDGFASNDICLFSNGVGYDCGSYTFTAPGVSPGGSVMCSASVNALFLALVLLCLIVVMAM